MPYGKGMDDALNYILIPQMKWISEKIDGYCGYAEYGEVDTYIGVSAHIDVNDEEAHCPET